MNALYTIKTDGPVTKISRNISAHTQFCVMRWPQTLPAVVKGRMATDGVALQIGDSRWNGGETYLTRGAREDSSRKFSLPNYSQVLKWKRYTGDVYWCTTPSVKGPVAILERARNNLPTKLAVFETLHDKYDLRGVLSYCGVYIPLMDHLLVTALLLVTDLQEWMLVKKCEGRSIIVPNPATREEHDSAETSTSDIQWRKILYREPLFPRLTSETSSSITGGSRDSYGAFYRPPPRSQGALYGDPSSHLAGQSILSFSSSEYDDDSGRYVRPPSPSMESTYYPASSDFAPEHGYADPTYRRTSYAVPSRTLLTPPIPPLPAEHRRPSQAPSFLSAPDSRDDAQDRRPSFSSDTASSSATPPHPVPNPDTTPATSHPAGNNDRKTSPSRARAMTGRPRPRPLPPVPSSINSLRRAQSHSLLSVVESAVEASTDQGQELLMPSTLEFGAPPLSPRSQRSLPPTPLNRVQLVGSPPPDVAQEELRVAAATVRAIREYQQRGGDTIHHIPDPPPTGKSEEEDTAQWVQILTSPSGHSHQPSLSQPMLDMPPPAYNTLSFSDRPPYQSTGAPS